MTADPRPGSVHPATGATLDEVTWNDPTEVAAVVERARAAQRGFRSAQARRALYDLRRNRAALRIQTRYRCHRGQLARLLLMRAKRERDRLMQRSALRVQRRVRIYQAKAERARRAAWLAKQHAMGACWVWPW